MFFNGLKRYLSLASGPVRQRARGKFKDRKFIDWKRVVVKAGNGGDGCVSFRKVAGSKVRYGPADGGNGGPGGEVVFTVHSSVRTLKQLRNHYRGGNGSPGGGAGQSGRGGRDVTIQVPPGTVVKDYVTGEVLADLLQSGTSYQAVVGGRGGLGNSSFSDIDNRRPVESSPGEMGDEVVLGVELRTIADVGLVGFPNAGKSTLLRALTRARPAVADYPFTTLNPQVGVILGENDHRIAVADIPGLIPGAHENRGLGHYFLRHIERCSCLLYVLDYNSPDHSIQDQYNALQAELRLYNEDLLDNLALIIVNKMDLYQSHDSDGRSCDTLAELRDSSGLPVVPLSGITRVNLDYLTSTLLTIVTASERNQATSL